MTVGALNLGSSAAVTSTVISMAAPDIIAVSATDPAAGSGGKTFGPFSSDTGTGVLPVTSTANNGSGNIRVTVNTATISNGAVVGLHSTTGSPNAIVGCYVANVINGTTLDLAGSVFDSNGTGGFLVVIGAVYTRTNPDTSLSAPCNITGPNFEYLTFYPTQNTTFIDRTSMLNAGLYPTIGGQTVTGVYMKAAPYSQAGCVTGGIQVDAATMRYTFYLKLSGNLPQGGPYTLSFPNGALPTVTFNFSDTATRCSSIRATQLGFRTSDTAKNAFLSVWVPGFGTEGRVDFINTYGLSTFQIIDSNGVVKFTGSITLQYNATDFTNVSAQPSARINSHAYNVGDLITVTGNALVCMQCLTAGTTASSEPGGYASVNQFGNTVTDGTAVFECINLKQWFASSTTPPKTLTAITNANPAVITLNSHGYTTGQHKQFRGIGGMSGIESTSQPITVLTANTFSIPVDTTSSGTYVSGTYLAGYDSQVYDMFAANPTIAHVFLLDFSSWTGATAGNYRVRIPGLGVSDPFEVSDAIYSKVAKATCGGFYNQLIGIALDGRFGYTHPIAFQDGVNGVQVFWSKYISAFSTQNNNQLGVSGTDDWGGLSPYITTTRATGWYGGFHDAGDWNSNLLGHGLALYELLDLAYEKLPVAAQPTNYGFPKATTTLNATTYAGTNSLPDAVQQVIYYLDGFRRLQPGGGGVPGGTGFSGNPNDGGVGGTGSGGPSWASRSRMWLMSADHASSFVYAGLAAKLALQFQNAGLSTLATLWQTSAVTEWNWANNLYQNLTNQTTYYNGTLNLQTNAGWSSGTFNSNMSLLDTLATGPRVFAAGCLFRLTGTASYGNIVDALFAGAVQSWTGAGIWEYCFSSGANATHVAYYLTNVTNGIPVQTANSYTNSTKRTPYRWMGYQQSGGGPSFGSVDGSPVPTDLIRAFIASYVQSGGTYTASGTGFAASGGTFDQQHLDVLRTAMGAMGGANQLGLCLLTGSGTRSPDWILHRDWEFTFSQTPPPGYVPYTFWGTNQGGVMFGNFSTDSPINFTVEIPTGSFSSTFGTKRIVAPYRFQWPATEAFWQNSFCISTDEFTTEQTIVPYQVMAMWLNGWDGNPP